MKIGGDWTRIHADSLSVNSSFYYCAAFFNFGFLNFVLQKAMTAAGFSIYDDEWWHFNDLSDPAALAGTPVFGREIGLP